jgi:hypothetical protein
MSFLAKLIFVSASWCPVYLLVAVLAWPANRTLSVLLLALSLGSLLLLYLLEKVVRARFARELVTASRSEVQKEDIFMYVLSYIPPFFAVDVSSNEKLVALLLLYFLIFMTYVRLDQYHLNPVFVFFGYRVFRVSTPGGAQLYVVANRDQNIRPGEQIRIAKYAELALLI